MPFLNNLSVLCKWTSCWLKWAHLVWKWKLWHDYCFNLVYNLKYQKLYLNCFPPLSTFLLPWKLAQLLYSLTWIHILNIAFSHEILSRGTFCTIRLLKDLRDVLKDALNEAQELQGLSQISASVYVEHETSLCSSCGVVCRSKHFLSLDLMPTFSWNYHCWHVLCRHKDFSGASMENYNEELDYLKKSSSSWVTLCIELMKMWNS